MNDASITEFGMVRGSVHKRGYGHKQATATPSVAGGSEAGDCGGDVTAGRVGVASGAALRRERQPGFRLATALPGERIREFASTNNINTQSPNRFESVRSTSTES